MKQKELLILSVVVFFTILAWVIIDLYHVRVSRSMERRISPATFVPVAINEKVFEQLEKKSN